MLDKKEITVHCKKCGIYKMIKAETEMIEALKPKCKYCGGALEVKKNQVITK